MITLDGPILRTENRRTDFFFFFSNDRKWMFEMLGVKYISDSLSLYNSCYKNKKKFEAKSNNKLL